MLTCSSSIITQVHHLVCILQLDASIVVWADWSSINLGMLFK